jgi:hypothetical protein
MEASMSIIIPMTSLHFPTMELFRVGSSPSPNCGVLMRPAPSASYRDAENSGCCSSNLAKLYLPRRLVLPHLLPVINGGLTIIHGSSRSTSRASRPLIYSRRSRHPVSNFVVGNLSRRVSLPEDDVSVEFFRHPAHVSNFIRNNASRTTSDIDI